MNKNELIKELEELRDIKDYSQSKLINLGYRAAILDAIDLVKQLTLTEVDSNVDICCPQCGNERLEEFTKGYYICLDKRCNWGDKL